MAERELALAEGAAPQVERAVVTLRQLGATEIYVFGSAVTGHWADRSDIDLAVRGIPPRLYYRAVAHLMGVLDRDFHLVDLELDQPFAAMLQEEGELLRVG